MIDLPQKIKAVTKAAGNVVTRNVGNLGFNVIASENMVDERVNILLTYPTSMRDTQLMETVTERLSHMRREYARIPIDVKFDFYKN
jgi:hypothetical protein